MAEILPTDAAPPAGNWRGRLARMGRGRALAAITLFSMAASLLVTALIMRGLNVPAHGFGEGLMIAVLVPLVVAPAASYGYLVLLYELEAAHAQLARSAMRDSLTEIHNRRYLMERLSAETAKAARIGSPLALLMIDVDRFKDVNDAHGHPVGDIVLREVARSCAACVRPYDVLARFGGEEFAVLMADTPFAEAMAVAERMRDEVSRMRVALDAAGVLGATVSIGVSLLEAGETAPGALIARADAALYEAKRRGRNCCAHVAAGERRAPATGP